MSEFQMLFGKSVSIIILALTVLNLASAQVGGPPGGGGNELPPGYAPINADWALKTELNGTWQTCTWHYDSSTGQISPVYDSGSWPNPANSGGGNTTSEIKRAFAKSSGTIHLKFLWRHLPTVPPEVLRIKVNAGVSVSANWQPGYAQVDTFALDSGLGLPIVDGSGLFNKSTPQLVLRKVQIGANGEGEMTITQRAEVEVVGGYSSCHAQAPSINVWADPRDVTIVSVLSAWPQSKFPGNSREETFAFSQDPWPYYPERITRQLTWNSSVPMPAILLTPNDCTDYSEWHIGFNSGKHEVLSGGLIDWNAYKTFIAATYIASGTLLEVDDTFEWQVQSNLWRAYDPVGPYVSPLSGQYDGIPIHALSHETAYVPAKFLKVLGPPDDAESFKFDIDLVDNVQLAWTWHEDGLRAESKRSVKLHQNSEPTNTVSSTWLELNVGRAYSGLLSDSEDLPGVPNINFFVDAGVSSCTLGEIYPSLEGLGAALSAAGPASTAVLAAIGVIAQPEFIVGFAAAEAIGALISLIPSGNQSFVFNVDWVNRPQVDSIEVVDKNFVYTLDGVQHFGNAYADYSEPNKLGAIRAAVYDRIHLYYWRAEVRPISEVIYTVHDLWGMHGFIGQEPVPTVKDKPLQQGYYKMIFIGQT